MSMLKTVSQIFMLESFENYTKDLYYSMREKLRNFNVIPVVGHSHPSLSITMGLRFCINKLSSQWGICNFKKMTNAEVGGIGGEAGLETFDRVIILYDILCFTVDIFYSFYRLYMTL